MFAAVLKDFNHFVLEEIPVPKPGPGEVLVKIVSCGFCATDYKAIKGIRRNVTFPLIPGHEPSGIVAETGPNVLHFKPGDEVICQPPDIAASVNCAWETPTLRTRLHNRRRSGRCAARGVAEYMVTERTVFSGSPGTSHSTPPPDGAASERGRESSGKAKCTWATMLW